MSYMTTDGVFDKIGSAIKSGVSFYGKSQADAATADLARQQAAAKPVDSGAGASVGGGGLFGMGTMGTIAVVGGVGVLAMMLLKKKKAAP